jgi:hypothetical protein
MKTLQTIHPTSPFSDAVISSRISIHSNDVTPQFNIPKLPAGRSSSTQAMAALLLLPIALTFSVISSSVVIEDPAQRLRNSGAVSVWGRIRRRAARLSLADARLRALNILAETEVRIQRERQQEFASLFADEDTNS